MKTIYLDTETTGLKPGQITQLSYIMSEDGELTAKNYFFKVDHIEPGAEALLNRGVDFFEKASGGKVFKDYYNEIYNDLKDNWIVTHNIEFDLNFLSMEFWRCGIQYSPEYTICSMNYFKPILAIPMKYGKKLKNPKLEEVVNYFNLNKDAISKLTRKLYGCSEEDSYHDARFDSTAMFVALTINKIKDKTDSNSIYWKDTFVNKG